VKTAARQKARNGRVALAVAGVVVAMVGLSFASVPLYDLFCRVTGFGGTTQRAAAPEVRAIDRAVVVRFNADTAAIPWAFQPLQRTVELKVGETGLAYYRATNLSDEPVVGTATFNVTPPQVGEYFVKIDCFCFTEQALAPGETVDMPVTFYVDPAIADDPELDGLVEVTLSYTFFRDPDAEAREISQAPFAAPALN